jgi:hypothetical protein
VRSIVRSQFRPASPVLRQIDHTDVQAVVVLGERRAFLVADQPARKGLGELQELGG